MSMFKGISEELDLRVISEKARSVACILTKKEQAIENFLSKRVTVKIFENNSIFLYY